LRRRTWLKIVLGSVGGSLASYSAWQRRDEWFEKRVAVVVPGKIVRGAWQGPRPLRRLLARERIKTILSISAINHDDPKYVAQAEVVREFDVDWAFVPIKGSYASVDEMERAVAILADPARQPIFYHCVAGHHRSSQVQAAYRIEREGWTADRAWEEVAALPWARPTTDLEDRRRIEAFAARNQEPPHAAPMVANSGAPAPLGPFGRIRGARRLDVPGLG